MGKERLRELLKNLQDELESTDSVGEGSRDLLKNVMDDLHSVLERSGEEVDEEGGTLGQKLKEATLQFEGEHPKLAAAVGRVVDALSQIGI